MCVAQGIRHIPSHARQDDISLEMNPLKAHHDRSPPLCTLGHSGRSYPISLANEHLRQIQWAPLKLTITALPLLTHAGSERKIIPQMVYT
jgi:hypothetical protein